MACTFKTRGGEKMKIFVCYQHDNGVGNLSVTIKQRKITMDIIRDIENGIKSSNNCEWVAVTNWKKLD